MDQSTLVGNQVEDGRRFVERFAVDGNPVHAAFWVKNADDDLWFLYLATPIVDRDGQPAAYRNVRASLQKLNDTWITSSEIKVVGENNPIVKDVLAIMARRPDRKGTRIGNAVLGSIAVDQGYIYPTHVFTVHQANAMTSEDVGREILRLMNLGAGVAPPADVTLNDGTHFSGVPFALNYDSQRAVVASFIVDGEAAPRVVRLDQISSII